MAKKKVAFICVHNSCRSQIAEAFGRHLASDVCFGFNSDGKIMKKKTIIFIIVLVVALFLMGIGWIKHATTSIPFQDAQILPSYVLEKQQRDLFYSKVMMIIGAILAMAAIIVQIWNNKKEKDNKADC